MELKTLKANANYFQVLNPTAEATAEAKKLAQRNWAKITGTGALIVHQSHREKFEQMKRREDQPRRVYVTAEEYEDGIGAHVGWNTVEIVDGVAVWS